MSLVKRTDLFQVPISKIVFEEGFNARQELGDMESLKASIKERGVRQPIHGHKTKRDKVEVFVVTDGHRRVMAARDLWESKQVKEEPVLKFIVEPRGYKDEDRLMDMITLNTGKDMTAIEMGDVYSRMSDLGWSETKIAQKVGMSIPHVSMCLKLFLGGSEELKAAVEDNVVAPSAGVEIVRKSSSKKEQKEVLKKITDKAEEEGVSTPEKVEEAKKGGRAVVSRTFVKRQLEEKKEKEKPVLKGMIAIQSLIEELALDGVEGEKVELLKDVFNYASTGLDKDKVKAKFA